MKIKTSLIFLILTFIVSSAIIGFVMFIAFERINSEVKHYNYANKIMKDMTELSIVTHEYFIHHEERMIRQWLLKYDSTARTLEETKKEEVHPEFLLIAESVTSDFKSLGDLFSQLQATYTTRKRLIEENKPQEEININLFLEERLTAHTLMRVQKITSEVFRFFDVAQKRMMQVQQRADLVVLFSIIGFGILAACVSLFVARRITEPLNELVKSAEIIGKGNLEHRVDIRTQNEIGGLAIAFNQMTENLKKVTTSRDELNKEITERKQAEETLRATNQQLQASDQQLRAANQQLLASEQQLKASNQQLRASEQQLKAANQQLIASEQQLRAANQQLLAEVAERKRAEEKIQASLREKEVLLKEIHHRVKNNMQVISSILNLQSKHIEDKQALKMFKNGQSRIKSMALVHEKMYESEDLAKIDVAEYVRSTTSYLFGLHGISEAIGSNIDIKDIFLDINTAIPCGLIINELVSNALKYAFPDGREGEIRIGLYLDKEGKFSLVVKDNGIGFPKDMDFRKTETLGMQLVIMLVEQIEGTIELERKEGTTFTITFEKPKSMDGEAVK